MRHEYKRSERFEGVVRELVDYEPRFEELKDRGCRIVCVTSDEAKKTNRMAVGADIEKVKDKYLAFIPYDFIITYYEPNIRMFSEEQLYALTYHELLHIGCDGANYHINPHDTQEFREVIERFGIDWAEQNPQIEMEYEG